MAGARRDEQLVGEQGLAVEFIRCRGIKKRTDGEVQVALSQRGNQGVVQADHHLDFRGWPLRQQRQAGGVEERFSQ
ncbi:hypothetical protein D3C73_1431880 [compost metagenome]